MAARGSNQLAGELAQQIKLLQNSKVSPIANWLEPDDAEANASREQALRELDQLSKIPPATKASAERAQQAAAPLGKPFQWVGWLRSGEMGGWQCAANQPLPPTGKLYVLGATGDKETLHAIGHLTPKGAEITATGPAMVEGRSDLRHDRQQLTLANRPQAMQQDTQYYLRVRGRVQGPFDHEKLQNFSRRGQLSRLHEVSTDGINWVRASTLPELFASPPAAAAAPVATPAPPSVAAPPPSVIAPPPSVTTAPAVALSAPPVVEPPPAALRSATLPPATSAPPLAAAERAEWWYSLAGSKQGPVAFSVLLQLTTSGQLGPSDFVWKSGLDAWRTRGRDSRLAVQPGHAHCQRPPAGGWQPRSAARSRRGTLAAVHVARGADALPGGGRLLPVELVAVFCAIEHAARSEWWLLLGGAGLVESCLLAGEAVLLAQHAGRLAGLDRSRQPAALEKAFAALRHFWLLAAVAVLVGLVLVALVLAALARPVPPVEIVARSWPA